MTIALTTPNGNVGAHAVRALVRAGERPRVLTRHPEALPDDLVPFVDAVAVDLHDSGAVVSATAGVEALFWVTPSTLSDDPLAQYAAFADALVAGITENGIGRVVFQSSIGAELRHGAGEIDGLAATEERLDGLGIDVVHLRCGYFMSNLLIDPDAIADGVFRTVLPVDAPMAWVAPRDIAEVAVGRLLSRAWSGRVVQAVHGPADLSWADAARIVSAATGRAVRAEQISDDALREGLVAAGMSPAQVDAIVGMSTGLRDGFVPEQPRDAATTTPTTLAEWAAVALR
jgi:uncharacterized protein YbjT (DUF2867 family)